MYQLLIADDEPGIRDIIRKYAVFEGYDVMEAGNGLETLELARQHPFDLILLDVMMPELDGFSVCRELRKIQDTPILMLSARGEEYDRIHGFENGADDYVVKPFSPRELFMRIQAILKRSHSSASAHTLFQYEGLQIDFTGRIVSIDGTPLNLTPKEYDLLFYLVQNRGIALSREKFIRDVWGYDFYGDNRTLDTHIKLLRKSLKEYGRCIVTLRGVGYRFEAEPASHAY